MTLIWDPGHGSFRQFTDHSDEGHVLAFDFLVLDLQAGESLQRKFNLQKGTKLHCATQKTAYQDDRGYYDTLLIARLYKALNRIHRTIKKLHVIMLFIVKFIMTLASWNQCFL